VYGSCAYLSDVGGWLLAVSYWPLAVGLFGLAFGFLLLLAIDRWLDNTSLRIYMAVSYWLDDTSLRQMDITLIDKEQLT
jgi:hypothetical protein